jgi:hypothetical protein
MNDDYYLGRSCPTEPVIDPATGAKLCELPNTVTPTPEASVEVKPQATSIPRVGENDGVAIFWALMLTALLLAGLALYDSWKGKK